MYYFTREKKKLVFITLELTEEENKIKIPKSIISTDGILDSTVKEYTPRFIKLINYRIVEDFNGKDSLLHLQQLLDSISDDDRVVVLDPESKIDIERRINVRHPNKLFLGPVINADFIHTLAKELLTLDYTDETDFDIVAYLKSKFTIDDLIDTKQLFFHKDMKPGRYYSYNNKETIPRKDSIGLDVPKSRIVLGKNTSTNIYAVYRVKPIEEFDSLYREWRSKLKYDLYAIMLLDKVVDSKNIYYRNRLKFRDTPKRLDSPTNDTLISEIRPAGLSYYAFKTFDYLDDILDDYLSTEDNVIKQSTIDITDMIYTDKDIKHDNGFHIDYEYHSDGNKYIIKLVSGLDLPDRNTLKRLLKKDISIKLIIVNEDNIMCRHYVVLDCKDEYSLICNYPANMTLLKDK